MKSVPLLRPASITHVRDHVTFATLVHTTQSVLTLIMDQTVAVLKDIKEMDMLDAYLVSFVDSNNNSILY